MKAFVTGGTGFIGGHVVRKLIERGYDVYALARSGQGASALQAMGAHVVQGDVTDKESMREGMRGSDAVLHIAAWYKIGGRDPWRGEAVNVGGTRNVLGLARELGTPRIIYTSTVAVFGDTHGQLVDESYVLPAGPFPTEYDRTKWEAHYHVALPMMAGGAPVTIVMPGAVYGPGDTSAVADLMRRFYLGQLPVLPGPETVLTFAHVDDIAEGHVLALEKGRVGESYILAGPARSFREIVDLWADLTGRPAPAVRVPARFVRPLVPFIRALESVVPLPSTFSAEAINLVGMTYAARSDKARSELGWQVRDLRQGMAETFDAMAASLGPVPRPDLGKQTAALALGAAAVLSLVWLLSRRRR